MTAQEIVNYVSWTPEIDQKRLNEMLWHYRASKVNGVEPKYLDAKINHESQTHRRAAKAVVETGRSFYFYGPPGCGKTYMAAALIRELYNDRQYGRDLKTLLPRDVDAPPPFLSAVGTPLIRYVCWRRLANQISAAPFEEKSGYLEKLERIDVLFLDEVYWTNQREYEWLFTVIDGRYTQCKQTVMFSNWSDKVLENEENRIAPTTGARLASRLTELCRDGIIALRGIDKRRVKEA